VEELEAEQAGVEQLEVEPSAVVLLEAAYSEAEPSAVAPAPAVELAAHSAVV
jgi:hypothetical protein